MGLIVPSAVSPGDDRGKGETAIGETLTKLINEFNGKISDANLKTTAALAASYLNGGITYYGFKENSGVDQIDDTMTVTDPVEPVVPDKLLNVPVPAGALILVGYEALIKTTGLVGADSTRWNAAIFLDEVQWQYRDTVATAGPKALNTFRVPGDAAYQPYPDVWQTIGIGASAFRAQQVITTDATDYAVGQGHPIGVISPMDAFGNTEINVGMMPVFANAGTYDISVRQVYTKTVKGLTSASTMQLKNRRLWAMVLSPSV